MPTFLNPRHQPRHLLSTLDILPSTLDILPSTLEIKRLRALPMIKRMRYIIYPVVKRMREI